jgi:hypothetical protein
MKELYPKYCPGKLHPFISLEQRVRVRDELEDFADEYGLLIHQVNLA